eukprot:3819933-Pyramimonas_sp.AAC.1
MELDNRRLDAEHSGTAPPGLFSLPSLDWPVPRVYNQMKRESGVEPNTRTLNTVVRAWAAGHNWESALQVRT